MSDINTFQLSLAAPVIEGMKRLGCPIDRLFRKSRLSLFDLQNGEAYAPLPCLYALFEQLHRHEGIEVPADVFGDEFKLEALGRWGETLAHSSSVLEACLLAERLETVNLTSQRIRLEIAGTQATLVNCFTDPDSPGRRELEYQALVLLVASIRLAAGPTWVPLEILLPGDPLPWMYERLPFDHSTVRTRTGVSGIVLRTDTLALPMLSPSLDAGAGGFPHTPQGIAQRIRTILDSSVDSLPPTINSVADIFEVSPRTLQRRLAQENLSFTDVVHKWRFETALKLLSNPSITVAEVSERLRYENSSNLERAFRRWTGVTPGMYRTQLT